MTKLSSFAILALVLTLMAAVLAPSSSNAAAGDVPGISKTDALIAIEDIRQTKARYFRCMDQRDWACFKDTMTADVEFDVSGALYVLNPDTGELMPSGDCTDQCNPANIPPDFGRFGPVCVGGDCAQTVTDWEARTLFGFKTFHQGGMPEVTLTSPATAAVTTALEHHLIARPAVDDSFVYYATNAQTSSGQLHGYGAYTEEYVKGGDGKWRIKKLRFRSYHVDVSYKR